MPSPKTIAITAGIVLVTLYVVTNYAPKSIANDVGLVSKKAA